MVPELATWCPARPQGQLGGVVPTGDPDPGNQHTPEQIIRKLREADRLLGRLQEVAVIAKQLEVSQQTLE